MANLPPWGRDELPEPLPFSPKNGAKTIGPGTILLATAIGGGEWMAGPSDDASLHTQCRDLAEGLAEELTYAGRDEALRDLQANTIWRATNQ